MRCKACDEVMEEHEIIWHEDWGIHEELCIRCRKKLQEEDEDLDPEALGLDIYIDDGGMD